ncbi:ABC transporter permease [Micromonospora sp. NPDC049836]|uniref:ABC transporter permease n=1 Tax=Micromonospora sp. NPDC049836 TaxID=3364274 RepID=UPI0037AD5AEE
MTVLTTRPGSRYAAALRTPRGLAGLLLVGGLALLALLAPVLAPGGYDAQGGAALAPASWPALFGTDELGRDVLARALYGLRTDLTLVGLAVPVSAALGTLLGLAGFLSRGLGTLIQRCLDVILGFPSLILGICVALVVGAGWWALFIAIVIYGLPAFGRLARASLLSQAQREYVLAAEIMGVPRPTIMLRHILPHALDPVIVQVAVGMVSGVFLESSLSIVGLGIQPPEPSLGALLNTGMRFMTAQQCYVLGPALLLLLLAFGLTLISDALNEAVHP